jgi:hypothetical protein
MGYRVMVTVLRSGPFRVAIYTNDHPPAHVHVQSANGEAVVDLAGEAPRLIRALGLGRADVRRAFELVSAHRDALLRKWSEIHGDAE